MRGFLDFWGAIAPLHPLDSSLVVTWFPKLSILSISSLNTSTLALDTKSIIKLTNLKLGGHK